MMDSSEEIKAKLNLETGKLAWHELERYFAKGIIIYINNGQDLLDIATAVAQDNKEEVAQLMKSGQLSKPSLQQAEKWHQDEQLFWTVVVSPWILIQEVISRN